MPDHKLISWCIDKLNQAHSKPFFLVPGIFRPHSPRYVPKKYYDLYPLDEIQFPSTPVGEFNDIPAEGVFLSNKENRFVSINETGEVGKVIQSYLAAISFADHQVGRMVDAVEESPYASNTIIVLWSDHGFHMGEKFHFAKSTLWEEAARIPFIIYAPGITEGPNCNRPMDTIDIYPTLADLCGIVPPSDIDGISMVPLIKNPRMKWKPAVTMLQNKNVSVRSEKFRYIRYVNGGEELYQHDIDPGEHTNLANEPSFLDVKKQLAKHIPEKFIVNALPFPYFSGYIPPQIRKEFEATKVARQAKWRPPSTYNSSVSPLGVHDRALVINTSIKGRGPEIKSEVIVDEVLVSAWQFNGNLKVVDGGNLKVNILNIGNQGNSGKLTVNGGTVIVDNILRIPDTKNINSVGLVELQMGHLSAKKLDMTSNGKLDIRGATLSLDGDKRYKISKYIYRGNIIGHGGTSTLNVVYDTKLKKTIVKSDLKGMESKMIGEPKPNLDSQTMKDQLDYIDSTANLSSPMVNEGFEGELDSNMSTSGGCLLKSRFLSD